MPKNPLILLTIILSSAAFVAAQATLDPDFEPVIARDLMSVEAWEANDDDYILYEVTIEPDGIDLAEIEPDNAACAGFTALIPLYRADWLRETIEEDMILRFFFVSDATDTTLAIREPDGDWLCADDWEDTPHPLIDVDPLRTGPYVLWVGSRDNAEISGQLVTTIGDYTPGTPPAQPLTFGSLFQGAGAGDSRIVYVELDVNAADATLDVSVDAVLEGERGDELRVAVYWYDAASDTPLLAADDAPQDEDGLLANAEEVRLRAGEERYDYSEIGKGAFEFQMPLDTLPAEMTVYPVVRVDFWDGEWVEVTRYAATRLTYPATAND